ncbi:MAG: hypothetical protein M3313_00125 [Actinomycetota bacterium]|nr:hypothetical protein [Actinomycetota bacterium]
MTRRLSVLLVAAVLVVLAALTVRVLAFGWDQADRDTYSAAPAVPPPVMTAYLNAATRVVEMSPGCAGINWSILAAVGAVESGHAADRAIAANGDIRPPIVGPRLDGSGVGGNLTPVPDTDGGSLDGDLEYDRAVGPLQFLPETWGRWGRDGNDDGTSDPHNIFDSALGAAAYLCGDAPADLTDRAQLTLAITRYNNSASYVADVLAYADIYAAAPGP